MNDVRFKDPEVKLVRFNDPSPSHYGKDKHEHQFCEIYDMLVEEKVPMEFRAEVLAYYNQGDMYGLQIAGKKIQDPVFLRTGHNILPVFCLKDSDGCANYVWTHPRGRRRGYARKLVQLLKITLAYHERFAFRFAEGQEETSGFWLKCGFKLKTRFSSFSKEKYEYMEYTESDS